MRPATLVHFWASERGREEEASRATLALANGSCPPGLPLEEGGTKACMKSDQSTRECLGLHLRGIGHPPDTLEQETQLHIQQYHRACLRCPHPVSLAVAMALVMMRLFFPAAALYFWVQHVTACIAGCATVLCSAATSHQVPCWHGNIRAAGTQKNANLHLSLAARLATTAAV